MQDGCRLFYYPLPRICDERIQVVYCGSCVNGAQAHHPAAAAEPKLQTEQCVAIFTFILFSTIYYININVIYMYFI